MGRWSERKIEIVTKYARAYALALKNQPFKRFYIDGFTGGGVALRKGSQDQVVTTARRILEIEPAFDGYHLVDFDVDKAAAMRLACVDRVQAVAYCGDANEILPPILESIRRSESKRALCFLDPYKILLSWKVLELAGRMGTIEGFINFPTLDIQRNVLRKDPSKIPPPGAARLTDMWGDDSWRQVAYAPQATLFGDVEEKQSIDALLAAFATRLKNVARFQHVSSPLVMRNNEGAIVYHLLFVTQQPLALKIANGVLKPYHQGKA
ncbi:three-Cys-motif partner protein TcmP [Reyranella aquatilis]|uniref:Three-Cys-motif partner protein TcmP n=1 Tax=Reyranella aquatilis TaxID=2035356 RepID=A0ABS8L3F7_9HYPH|nr:three-Cys-motif partner protein TcmP [Reyranella aquatilis]